MRWQNSETRGLILKTNLVKGTEQARALIGEHFGEPERCARHQELREPRGRRRTHPCRQTAAILVVTVPRLEARARAVILLLHQPVVESFPRQAGVDYKTVA